MDNLESPTPSIRALHRGERATGVSGRVGQMPTETRASSLLPLRCLFAITILLVCSGCATTQVRRADQLGTLGKAYVEAVTALSAEALASSIDFSLTELRKERQQGAFRNRGEREDAIKTQIDTLLQRQALVALSNRQLALVEEYFTTLQQFAKEDIAGSFETATGDLTQSINDVGAAIEKDPQANATISEPERTAIGKLAGLVAQQIHGAVLAGILKRDAALIGTQLILISKTLTTYSTWIRDRMDFELADEYKKSVVKPFVDSGDLAVGWDHDVREYLNGRQLSKELSNAELASMKMERYWSEYLAGRTSLGDLADDLKDIKKLLDAIAGVRGVRGK